MEEELDDFKSLRIVQADEASSLEGGEMADLEAELEAELDHLTGQYSDLDEVSVCLWIVPLVNSSYFIGIQEFRIQSKILCGMVWCSWRWMMLQLWCMGI